MANDGMEHAIAGLVFLAHPEPVRIIQLERALEMIVGIGKIDHYEVLDSVWLLVKRGELEFTPGRLIICGEHMRPEDTDS